MKPALEQANGAVRKRIAISILILIPFVAHADPILLDPFSMAFTAIIVLLALAVESGVVVFLLLSKGVAPLPFFVGYLVTNVAVFVLLFCSLMWRRTLPLAGIESLVVATDCMCIKLLVCFERFQTSDYQSVSWLRAIVASLTGNAASLIVGMLVRSP